MERTRELQQEFSLNSEASADEEQSAVIVKEATRTNGVGRTVVRSGVVGLVVAGALIGATMLEAARDSVSGKFSVTGTEAVYAWVCGQPGVNPKECITATPEKTAPTAPTKTPKPTNTPPPTNTPEATATTKPTNTPQPESTNTPVPTPTETTPPPNNTAIPTNTATLVPSATSTPETVQPPVEVNPPSGNGGPGPEATATPIPSIELKVCIDQAGNTQTFDTLEDFVNWYMQNVDSKRFMVKGEDGQMIARTAEEVVSEGLTDEGVDSAVEKLKSEAYKKLCQIPTPTPAPTGTPTLPPIVVVQVVPTNTSTPVVQFTPSPTPQSPAMATATVTPTPAPAPWQIPMVLP